jgi:hypothetical protein
LLKEYIMRGSRFLAAAIASGLALPIVLWSMSDAQHAGPARPVAPGAAGIPVAERKNIDALSPTELAA